MFYSASAPHLVADWKAVVTESFTYVMYWAPLTKSTKILAPIFSGPKHQILEA